MLVAQAVFILAAVIFAVIGAFNTTNPNRQMWAYLTAAAVIVAVWGLPMWNAVLK